VKLTGFEKYIFGAHILSTKNNSFAAISGNLTFAARRSKF
jgi:hypothetical protein